MPGAGSNFTCSNVNSGYPGFWGISDGSSWQSLLWPDGSNMISTFQQGQSYLLCSDLTGSTWTSFWGYTQLPNPPPYPPPPRPPSPPPPPPPSPGPPPPKPPPAPPPRPPPVPAAATYSILSAATGMKFDFYGTAATQAQAEAACTATGGFLVTYNTGAHVQHAGAHGAGHCLLPAWPVRKFCCTNNPVSYLHVAGTVRGRGRQCKHAMPLAPVP